MIPGMERRITEHYLSTSDAITTASSEHSNRSVQEIPLLKGSFGHTSTYHTRSNNNMVVPADSSEESLYGMDRAMVMSESVNSVIGLTRSSSNYDGYSTNHHHRSTTTTNIPVTAEIVCPTPPPPAVVPPMMSTGGSCPPLSSVITSPASRDHIIRHSQHSHQQSSIGLDMSSPPNQHNHAKQQYDENGISNQPEISHLNQVNNLLVHINQGC